MMNMYEQMMASQPNYIQDAYRRVNPNAITPPAPRPQGILNQNNPGQGILNNTNTMPPARRDQASLSKPNLRIGMGEALMRIGGAGARASQNGGLEAIGAMTDQYGAIQDANRSQALAEYQAAMEAQAEMAKAAAANKPEDNSERIGQIDQTLYDMERAKSLLSQPGASVTGFWDTYIGGAWDKMTGNKDQMTRKLLSRLRVDDTLLRIAQTKGAISNKEMDLFLSPAPDMTDQETVWIDWISDRQQALSRIRERLSTGQQVSDVATADQVGRFGSGLNEIQLDDDTQAIVDELAD